MLGRPRRQPPRHTALPQTSTVSHLPFIPPFQFGLGPAENHPGKRRKYARSNKVGQLHNLEGTPAPASLAPGVPAASRLFDRVAFTPIAPKIPPELVSSARVTW